MNPTGTGLQIEALNQGAGRQEARMVTLIKGTK